MRKCTLFNNQDAANVNTYMINEYSQMHVQMKGSINTWHKKYWYTFDSFIEFGIYWHLLYHETCTLYLLTLVSFLCTIFDLFGNLSENGVPTCTYVVPNKGSCHQHSPIYV
jgi:hypothetical protein